MPSSSARNRGSVRPVLQRQADPRSDYRALRSDRQLSGYSILPLRLFLGITFVYAAIQKVNDPGFLHAGTATYIGAQILAFSRGSPIQALLHQLMQFAVLVGVVTIVIEGCIGLLVMLGLFTRPAALVGMVLSMGFFLSASWGTYPYFFGSDIVFVVCWLTLAITGPGVFALDDVVEGPIRAALDSRRPSPRQRLAFSLLTGMHGDIQSAGVSEESDSPSAVEPTQSLQSRRRLTRGEALAGSLVTLGLIALGLHPRGGSTAQSTGQLSGSAPSASGGAASSPPQSGSGSSIPTGARKIGNISQLPPNTAGTVTDPKTGDPAVIVHTSGSTFYAYDAVCTHAGCTVQYDPSQRLLVCPCHGGTFDPAHGAQVLAGPPPSPLTPIEMKIDQHGNIYIV